MPSKLSTSSGSVCVPSYLRGTVSSGAKQREKVVPKARVEAKKTAVRRKLEVAREKKGYQQLTKTAKAKVSPRTYVLEGVRVEVPMIVFEQFDDSEEDKWAYIELLEEEERQKRPTLELLFDGRHTYRDIEGEVVVARCGWKEELEERTGINWDCQRYCLAMGEKYPDGDDDDEDDD